MVLKLVAALLLVTLVTCKPQTPDMRDQNPDACNCNTWEETEDWDNRDPVTGRPAKIDPPKKRSRCECDANNAKDTTVFPKGLDSENYKNMSLTLRGPWSITKQMYLDNVTELEFQQCGDRELMDSEFEAILGGMPNLQKFQVRECNLKKFNMPESIDLSNLKSIRIEETGLEEFNFTRALPDLYELELRKTNIQWKGISMDYPNLCRLNLRDNNLGGHDLSLLLGKLDLCDRLDLSRCQIDQATFETLNSKNGVQFLRLRDFRIKDNQIEKFDWPSLGQSFRELKEFEYEDNPTTVLVTGSMPRVEEFSVEKLMIKDYTFDDSKFMEKVKFAEMSMLESIDIGKITKIGSLRIEENPMFKDINFPENMVPQITEDIRIENNAMFECTCNLQKLMANAKAENRPGREEKNEDGTPRDPRPLEFRGTCMIEGKEKKLEDVNESNCINRKKEETATAKPAPETVDPAPEKPKEGADDFFKWHQESLASVRKTLLVIEEKFAEMYKGQDVSGRLDKIEGQLQNIESQTREILDILKNKKQ